MFEAIEEHNRGSAENPMSDVELRAKFDDNASGFLSASEIGLRGEAENLIDVRALIDLTQGRVLLYRPPEDHAAGAIGNDDRVLAQATLGQTVVPRSTRHARRGVTRTFRATTPTATKV